MSAPATSAEQTVDLKNRWLAAALALLMPGLGHLYQGRNFKAAVYCVCILGLFLTGQALGEWKVVYLSDTEAGGRVAAGGGLVKRLLQGYGAQFPVGLLAWPAILQSHRYHQEAHIDRPRLEAPLSAPFRGGLWVETINGPRPLARVHGTVTLEPAGTIVRGRFEGTTEEGRPIEVVLSRVREMGPRVGYAEERPLFAQIAALPEGIDARHHSEVYFAGGIPRPFRDRYQVPLGTEGENHLTAKLGGRLEIAFVFTWIAGLLNILAIWDALDGPAYGMGNEPEVNRKRRRKRGGPQETEDRADRPEPVSRLG